MPPSHIPEWFFPGCILQDRSNPDHRVWIETISSMEGVYTAMVREILNLTPVTVQQVFAYATLDEMREHFEPWLPDELGIRWSLNPHRASGQPIRGLTDRPIVGFTRRITSPSFGGPPLIHMEHQASRETTEQWPPAC